MLIKLVPFLSIWEFFWGFFLLNSANITKIFHCSNHLGLRTDICKNAKPKAVFEAMAGPWTFIVDFWHFLSQIYLLDQEFNVDFENLGYLQRKILKRTFYEKGSNQKFWLFFLTLGKCHSNDEHQISFWLSKVHRECFGFPYQTCWPLMRSTGTIPE